MKKILVLFIMVALIATNSQAQNMTVPDPNTPNTLFLKFSHTLNSPYAYIPDVDISEYEEVSNYKPLYLFTSGGIMNASLSIMRNYFYAINPEEFAYIDPALYNSVSLSKSQLIDVLKTKTTDDGKNYLGAFTTIYLIDYEQKYAKNTSKVKILKVRPYYNFFR
ncbi:MAG: hypothetical protein MUC49_20810 [Raineya sp.]|jgi:hypothetical protein|nr:hypothetical protein [Raineya sp.]